MWRCFFLEFVICINIRFFFCVQLDPSFNILCVQKKNECVPGRNDALWIHLWRVVVCKILLSFHICRAKNYPLDQIFIFWQWNVNLSKNNPVDYISCWNVSVTSSFLRVFFYGGVTADVISHGSRYDTIKRFTHFLLRNGNHLAMVTKTLTHYMEDCFYNNITNV